MKKVYINKEIYTIKGIEFGENDIPLFNKQNALLIDKYVRESSSYASQNFISDYFKEHVGDTSLDSICIKIILIDATDSTNLLQRHGKNFYNIMGKRIIDAKIEEKIKNGESFGKLFKCIAKTPKSNGDGYINEFVFLSKYITRTNQYSYDRDDYSIMDTVVRENLYLLSTKDLEITNSMIEEIRDNYDFDGYCKLIKRIIEQPRFNGVTRRQFDHFIWFTFKKENAEDARKLNAK